MSRYLKSLLLASTFLLAPLAHAADAAPANPNDLYVGLGLFSDMMNVNVEKVTPWGNFMVRVGRFQGVEGLAYNATWRTPLEGDDGNATGFYLGAFAGHVAGESIANHGYQRMGLGGEMSYQWVTEYTRRELAVGLGAAEPLEVARVKYTADPAIYISFSMALGY